MAARRKTKRTLLLDSDIVAYQVAAIQQKETAFGFGITEEHWEHDARSVIDRLVKKLNATDVIVCLTDTENFRKDILPTYKENRKDVIPPLLLKTVKQFLAENYDSYIRPTLEADDVMGILATNPKIVTGDKIIVSEDKDMRTIPAKLYNPNHSKLGVQTISVEDADRFHLWQTIVGDMTDGYGGAKGVGKTSVYAEEVIAAETLEEAWEIVWDAYSSVGLTEEDAIVQARCARILRHEDYDYKNKRPILWNPPIVN